MKQVWFIRMRSRVDSRRSPFKAGAAVCLSALLCLVTTANAVAQQSGSYTYVLDAGGNASITRFNKEYTGQVSIPDTLGGHPVTGIADAAFSGCAGLTAVTIPKGVTSIGEGAFICCSGMTGVTIPDSVTNVGKSAFTTCASLISVTLPGGVTRIADAVFSGCTALTTVEIPGTVTEIGEGSFSMCKSLSRVTLPGSMRALGSSAFEGCSGLGRIVIPDSVTSIGEFAFYNCDLLKSVTIGRGVNRIGTGAFRHCGSLAAIDVASANPSYSGLDGVLFDKPRQTLIRYPGGRVGTYHIPGSVILIGKLAFSECPGLTRVTVPARVSRIGGSAFAFSKSLVIVTFAGDAPRTDPEVYGNADHWTAFYYPGTKGWGKTFAGRPAVPLQR